MADDFTYDFDLDDDDGNFLESFGGGLYTGVLKDPLVGPAVSEISSLLGFSDEEQQIFTEGLRNSTSRNIGEFIGEWSPVIIGSITGFGVGSAAVRGAAGILGKSALKAGATSATTGLRGQFARQAIINQAKRPDAQAIKKLDAAVRRRIDAPEDSLKFVQQYDKFYNELKGKYIPGINFKVPGAVRAMEIAGGAIGEGAFMGAHEFSREYDIDEATKAALLTTAISGTFGGALLGIGKALHTGGDFAESELKKDPRFLAAAKLLYEKVAEPEKASLASIKTKIDNVLGVDRQLENIEGLTGKVGYKYKEGETVKLGWGTVKREGDFTTYQFKSGTKIVVQGNDHLHDISFAGKKGSKNWISDKGKIRPEVEKDIAIAASDSGVSQFIRGTSAGKDDQFRRYMEITEGLLDVPSPAINLAKGIRDRAIWKKAQEKFPGIHQRSEFHAEVERLVAETGKLRREAIAIKSNLRQLYKTLVTHTDSSILYSRGTPKDFNAVTGWLRNILTKIAITPESYEGKMGVILSNVIRGWKSAEADHLVGRSYIQSKLTEIQVAMGKAANIGVSKTGRQARGRLGLTKDNQKLWAELFNARESLHGEQAVKDLLTKRGIKSEESHKAVLDQFTKLEKFLKEIYKPLQQLGGGKIMGLDELMQNGTSFYVPKVLRELGDARLKKLAVSMDSDYAEFINREIGKGFNRYGSVDNNRKIKGTLLENLSGDNPLPFISDPWQANYMYLVGANRRYAYASRFGMMSAGRNTDKVIAGIKQAAMKEGANPQITNTIVDAVFDRTIHDATTKRMSQLFVNSEIASKLTLAVIPNLSQSVNTMMMFGFKNTVSGLFATARRLDSQQIMTALALQDSVYSGLGRASAAEAQFAEDAGSKVLDKMATWADIFADRMLRHTGFTWTEKQNRLIAGHAAQYTMMETLFKAHAGKLTGRKYLEAKRRMADLGINLDEAVVKFDGVLRSPNYDPDTPSKFISDMAKKAVVNGAQKSQFTPGATRRPIWWNHPVGQMVFQFKNYALGQTRFLSDQIFREAYNGNYKPLAYLASVYPVAGEFVKDFRSFVYQKERDPDNGMAQLYQNFLAVGGWGVATDIVSASFFGRLKELLLGPSITDMMDVAQAIISGKPHVLVSMTERQPLFKATKSSVNFLTGTAAYTKRGYESWREEDDKIDYWNENFQTDYINENEVRETIPELIPGNDFSQVSQPPKSFNELIRERNKLIKSV
tara:strand:- start:660 stop:4337 length:3678 start_codon:yes stop_codon:yes gene_type:complete